MRGSVGCQGGGKSTRCIKVRHRGHKIPGEERMVSRLWPRSDAKGVQRHGGRSGPQSSEVQRSESPITQKGESAGVKAGKV